MFQRDPRNWWGKDPSEEIVMANQPTYRSQVLDHLGLVAGIFDELTMGDIIDQATQQNPEKRDITVGEAVNAMVLNGLRCINQALSLVHRFFQIKPTYRLISPRVAPEQRNDDALGRALDTLYDYGVTALYSLIAATAAKRLHLSPTYMHLDRRAFMSMGAITATGHPLNQSCTSPRATVEIIARTLTKSCWS
jgi:transposase